MQYDVDTYVNFSTKPFMCKHVYLAIFCKCQVNNITLKFKKKLSRKYSDL